MGISTPENIHETLELFDKLIMRMHRPNDSSPYGSEDKTFQLSIYAAALVSICLERYGFPQQGEKLHEIAKYMTTRVDPKQLYPLLVAIRSEIIL